MRHRLKHLLLVCAFAAIALPAGSNRAAFIAAFQGKKLKGVCFCTIAIFGSLIIRAS